GIYDTTRPELVCNTPAPCHNDSYADLGNAAHGHEYELDQYASDGTTLLKQVKTKWAAACPPPGVSGTPPNANWGNWDGGLVAELDHSNPVMVCEVHPMQVDTLTYDGLSGGQIPDQVTTYAYDGYGRVTSQGKLSTTGLLDSSGHGGHAVWSGGVGLGAAGLVGGDSDRALSLDGVSGEIDTGYVQSGVGAYSVEAWVRTSAAGARKAVAQDRGPGGGQSLSLLLSGGKPVFELDSNSLEIGVAATAAINDGQPHHLVGTWAGGGAVTPSQFTV